MNSLSYSTRSRWTKQQHNINSLKLSFLVINQFSRFKVDCDWIKERIEIHIIYSIQINILYSLHRNTHYILYSDKHTISSSQKYTLYTLFRYTHYILFSDIHTISSSQIYTLYPLHRYTHYILFSDIHTIFCPLFLNKRLKTFPFLSKQTLKHIVRSF